MSDKVPSHGQSHQCISYVDRREIIEFDHHGTDSNFGRNRGNVNQRTSNVPKEPQEDDLGR